MGVVAWESETCHEEVIMPITCGTAKDAHTWGTNWWGELFKFTTQTPPPHVTSPLFILVAFY